MEFTTPSSEDDLLSQLPSEVLVSILEKLSLRDAVRVGVLSRRWRCLPAQLPRLVLDIANFLPGKERKFQDHDDGVDDDGEPAAVAENAVNDVFSDAGDKMADAATALLASRTRRPPSPAGGSDNNSNHSLDTLAMRFYLRHNYMSLGRLLQDAVASGKVRKVELTITTTFRILEDEHERDYESNHSSLVGYGRRFKSLLDACPAVLGAQLTQLTLENMRHGGPGLDDGILATCTRLEKLTMKNYGPEHGTLWRVRHAWLQHINIIVCFPTAIQLLWLPRLESFTLRGWLWASDRLVSFGHVPRLTAVTMCGDIANGEETLRLSRIFANSTTALTDLRLNFSGNNIWVRPETSRRLTDAFSKLKNLKICNVNRECGLAWTMFLLQSAPHLEELYIKLMEHNCGDLVSSRKNVPWEVDSSFEHYNLVRVTISRFYSTEETIVTFTRRLIQAAVNLEEICFCENAVLRCAYCGREDPNAASRFPPTDQDRDTFRKKIITENDGRSTNTIKIHFRS